VLLSFRVSCEELDGVPAFDSEWTRRARFARTGGYRFGSSADVARRNVFPRELTQAGILNQESIGTPSIRNDAAFLISVVGVTSAVAVVSAAVLPGEAVCPSLPHPFSPLASLSKPHRVHQTLTPRLRLCPAPL
jgi:hypothetical protein